jgi:hypothetical protein
VQFVLQERPPEFPLHEALALRGVLPVGEADFLHDVVDVRNDALDNDVRIGVLRFLEELRQRFLGAVALLFGVGFFLGFNDFLGDLRICLRNSRLVRKPCSWRSLIFSNRSPRAVNFG